jgi:hypothetical protein
LVAGNDVWGRCRFPFDVIFSLPLVESAAFLAEPVSAHDIFTFVGVHTEKAPRLSCLLTRNSGQIGTVS